MDLRRGRLASHCYMWSSDEQNPSETPGPTGHDIATLQELDLFQMFAVLA